MSQPKSQNEEFKSDQTISEAREKERERETERERERERERRAAGERKRPRVHHACSQPLH